MSVQTELNRLTAAKSGLKTAIEGKGVTVPEGTKLDGYGALVSQIQSGGGEGEFQYTDVTVNVVGLSVSNSQSLVISAICKTGGNNFYPDLFYGEIPNILSVVSTPPANMYPGALGPGGHDFLFKSVPINSCISISDSNISGIYDMHYEFYNSEQIGAAADGSISGGPSAMFVKITGENARIEISPAEAYQINGIPISDTEALSIITGGETA